MATRTPREPEDSDSLTDRAVEGLAIGHGLATLGPVPFGDPLPHGHFGTPTSMAFWAGMGAGMIDDEEEED